MFASTFENDGQLAHARQNFDCYAVAVNIFLPTASFFCLPSPCQNLAMLTMPARSLVFVIASLAISRGIVTMPNSLEAREPVLQESVEFNRDVRPILAEHCFACHGPDANQRKADLRLDVRDNAVENGAIIPSDASGSELVRRINVDDPDQVMPPPTTRKPLTAAQKKSLERWIANGAEYSQHWAFVAPRRPSLPDVTLGTWPRGAIDRFVLARLEQAGLAPSPSADRRTLHSASPTANPRTSISK